MRNPVPIAASVVAAFALVALGQQTATKKAAPKTPPKKGQTYASLAILPDWSGAWTGYWLAHGRLRDPAGDTIVPPLRPPELARFQEMQRAAAQRGDNQARARAGGTLNGPLGTGGRGGFNGSMALGPTANMEVLFTPGRVTFVNTGGTVRRVFTDGTVADPTFISAMGTSTGYWDGDALVVDTIGLNPKTMLLSVIQAGEGFKVHERIFLKEKDVLEDDAIVEAPDAFTGPYKMLPELFQRIPGTVEKLQDYIGETAARDRSVDPKTGSQTFDLTPPSDIPPPPAN